MNSLNNDVANLAALSESKESSGPLATYEEKEGRMVWNRSKDTQSPLCNFTAHISSEEIQDDGADRKMSFVIEGRSSDGRPFSPVVVPSDKYSGMTWVNAGWGTRAIVYAGHSVKDHLRVAIQMLSGDVPGLTVYTHLGWRKILGRWYFLYAGGAIGENEPDVQVSPQDGRLNSYVLPQPPHEKDLKEAIEASLSYLDLAPLKISAPLLASIYRAPLGECCKTDFSIFLSGASGCQKSELSAIAQAHFGKEFNRTNLPGNWASTGNALERQAFLAKDAIFTVDDFAPTGSAVDVARLHKEADRLLRGAGNSAGRERLTSDARARPQYYPRGLIISSGEDIPQGISVRARICILEVCKGDVDLKRLTEIQARAASGCLAKSMSGYIKWLAPQMDSLKELLPTRQRDMRGNVNIGGSHARTPDLIINLGIGLEYFLQYAEQSGAIDSDQSQACWKRCWEALLEAGGLQTEHHIVEDPTAKFFNMLCAAIVSGKAHLVDSETGAIPLDGKRWGWFPEGTVIRDQGVPEIDHWRQRGDKIGWIQGSELFLNPDAAYACAQEVARKQNNSIATSANTLWKRLVQKGLATKGEPGRNLCKKTVEGVRQRVLVIPDKELLYGFRSRGNGGTGDTIKQGGPFSPQKLSPEFRESKEWGLKIGTETLDR